MRHLHLSILAVSVMSVSLCFGALADERGKVLLEDDFNRSESDETQEQVGNDWGTNSKSRAQGVKQVDLRDGAMFIRKAEVADHGVSVTHEAAFQDAVISLRFKLGKGDDLGINIADMNEKSVHAGHICLAKVGSDKLEMTDLKTGRMKLENREARLAEKLTDEQKQAINRKSRYRDLDISTDEWHTLEVRIEGPRMTVIIDDKQVGSFESEGIGHATKSRLRLAVNREAWVDDVRIVRLK